MEVHAQRARRIFEAALEGVRPDYLLDRFPLQAVSDQPLSGYGSVYVVGGGKASLVMGGALEEKLGDHLTEGLLTVPHGYSDTIPDWARLPERIEVVEAGHPLPDEAGVSAAGRMLELCDRAGENDLVLTLVSGGGSALLPQFADDISLEDARRLQEALIRSGATIHEINTVRKHCSLLKGGQLARRAGPARLRALVLSDVVGNDLSVIASGPTVPDSTTFEDAIQVLRSHDLWEELPDSVRAHLRRGREGEVPETCNQEDPAFDRTDTAILGSNRDALKAARKQALEYGYQTEIVADDLTGEAREVGREIVRRALEADPQGPICFLWSGETTVTVAGDGKGGRNQELVLGAALEMEQTERPTIVLSAGTDGVDGPTDAAGAWATQETIEHARRRGLDPESHLANNDSYSFFDPLDRLLRTGPTHTNVMDLQVAIVDVS